MDAQFSCVHVSVYIQRKVGGRAGGKNRERDRREMVNESIYQQTNLDKCFMVLISIHTTSAHVYLLRNKYIFSTDHSLFFLFFVFKFYLTFHISAFESHRYPQHCTQTPGVCKGPLKQMLWFLSQTGNVGCSAHLNSLTLPRDFTKH